MKFQEIKNGVYYCGLNDCNRDFFDELIPLEKGTSYNSYLVKSDKIALIDTMYPPKTEEYINNLDENEITKIDYIIANHGEQDHSGALPRLVKKYPQAIILTNQRCKEILQDMHHIEDDKFQIVTDGEEISLGSKTLRFIYAPWVHWPDTMFTYIVEDNLLCTCDFLGSHYTFTNIYSDENEELMKASKRYYAEIMMPFRIFCKRALEKVKTINPELILSSHGPIHKNPQAIIKCYEDWTSDNVKNVVLMPYVSMYNSTKEMMDYVRNKLVASGIEVKEFELVRGDVGELAMDLIDAATIVMGASMTLAMPHPASANAAYLINLLRPKTQFISFIGSYGWGGDLIGKLTSMLSCVKAEMIEPVLVKGKAREEDYKKLDELSRTIIRKHMSIGLL